MATTSRPTQPSPPTPGRSRRPQRRAGFWRAYGLEVARYIFGILAALGLMAALGWIAGLFVTVPPG